MKDTDPTQLFSQDVYHCTHVCIFLFFLFIFFYIDDQATFNIKHMNIIINSAVTMAVTIHSLRSHRNMKFSMRSSLMRSVCVCVCVWHFFWGNTSEPWVPLQPAGRQTVASHPTMFFLGNYSHKLHFSVWLRAVCACPDKAQKWSVGVELCRKCSRRYLGQGKPITTSGCGYAKWFLKERTQGITQGSF